MQRRTKVGAGIGAVALLASSFAVGNQLADDDGPQPAAVIAEAPCPTITRPFRPGYEDVSLKVFNDGGQYKWFRGCVATNTQRRGMEQTVLSYLGEVFRYARTLPSCSAEIERALGTLGAVQARYKDSTRAVLTQFDGSTPYDDLTGDGGGKAQNRLPEWSVGQGGGHYQFEEGVLTRINACSVSSRNRAACGTSPLMTPNLQILLDVKITNGQCVKGSTQVLPANEKFTSSRGGLGVARGKCVDAKTWDPVTKLCRTIKVDPLPSSDVEMLHATHDAHAMVSEFRCGTGPQPPFGIVGATHQAYEGTARTEEEHSFRRMQDFFGTADPLWSQADVCTLFRIADALHAEWVDCQVALDWACSDRAGKAHHRAHFCLGLKDDRYQVRPPGEPADHQFTKLLEPRRTHPNVTCAQWIAEYRSVPL